MQPSYYKKLCSTLLRSAHKHFVMVLLRQLLKDELVADTKHSACADVLFALSSLRTSASKCFNIGQIRHMTDTRYPPRPALAGHSLSPTPQIQLVFGHSHHTAGT